MLRPDLDQIPAVEQPLDLRLDLESLLVQLAEDRASVIRLLVEGYRVKEAAEHLMRAMRTVERHLRDDRKSLARKLLEPQPPPQTTSAAAEDFQKDGGSLSSRASPL